MNGNKPIKKPEISQQQQQQQPGFGFPQLTSPYAGNPIGETARIRRGTHRVLGGPQDLLPSVATRGLAIDEIGGLLDRVNSGADAGQLQNTLAEYAQGNPYLASMIGASNPSIARDYRINDVTNKRGLTDLLSQAHVLGGNIQGSQWANVAYLDNYFEELNRQNAQKVQGVFGGIPYIGGFLGGIVGATV